MILLAALSAIMTRRLDVESDQKMTGSGPQKTCCPYCPGWEIKRRERCSNTLVHGRRSLYFCSRPCKERFERNPGHYLGGTA
jgi:hypothetical protein